MSSKYGVVKNLEAEYLPMEMGYLPDSFKKKREIELNYTPEVEETTLRELKALLADDDTMKRVRLKDELLLMYLSSRKYDVNKTFQQLEKFIAFRDSNIDMFTNIKFESISPVSEVISPLPWRCPDGCTIFNLNLDTWRNDKHPIEAVKHMYVVTSIMSLREPMTQVNGYKIICNMKVSPGVLKLATPHNLYLLLYGIQAILPARIKEVHLINMGIIGRIIYPLCKMFFTDKLRNRIHMHSTLDSLLKFFPKAVLPCDYGGNLENYDMTDWLKKITTTEELSFMDVHKI